jgi:hypothetical protein
MGTASGMRLKEEFVPNLIQRTLKQGIILGQSAGKRMILKWIIVKYNMTVLARFIRGRNTNLGRLL